MAFGFTSSSAVLRESSIHGLRYLAEARGCIAKLTWLVLISASVTLAGIIVYKNWTEWWDSPAVVTSVKPALVTESVTLPQVAVCPPHQANAVSLVHHLLGARSNLSEHVSDDVVNGLRLSIYHKHLDAHCHTGKNLFRTFSSKVEAVFEACMEANSTHVGTRDCRLIQALGLIQSVHYGDLVKDMSYNLRRDLKDVNEVTKAYLEEVSAQEPVLEAQLTVEGLVAKAEEMLRVSGIAQQPMEVYAFFDLDEIIEAYGCLFPFPKKSAQVTAELDDDFPRPVESYDFSWVPAVPKESVASLILTLSDRAAFAMDNMPLGFLKVPIAYSVLNAASAFLGLDVKEDTLQDLGRAKKLHEHDLFRLTNAFHVDYFESGPKEEKGKLFFDFKALELILTDNDFGGERFGDEYFHPCGSLANATGRSLDQVCEAGAADAACRDYCSLVGEGLSAERREAIRDLFEMGLDVVGPTVIDGMPHSLLPACLHPGHRDGGGVGSEKQHHCWERVDNDKGVCYISQTFPNTEKIEGTSDDFFFLLDATQPFLMEGSSRESNLFLLPPNNYAAGTYTDMDNVFRFTWYEDWNVGIAINYISTATDDFKRGCLYPDEKPLKYFPVYSEANCYLEEAWEIARAKCGCVPWTLVSRMDGALMCERYGNWCFKTLVDARLTKDFRDKHALSQRCPYDCEDIDITVNWDKMVPHKDSIDDRPIRARVNINSSIQDLAAFLEGSTKSETAFRQTSVYLSSKKSLIITQAATATLVDMISNIGGTFGLFCGFSILSLVEIFYWLERSTTCGKSRRAPRQRGKKREHRIKKKKL